MPAKNTESAATHPTPIAASQRVVAEMRRMGLFGLTIPEEYGGLGVAPADLANVMVFLASDESRMLTGTTIAADGGRSSYLRIYAGDD